MGLLLVPTHVLVLKLPQVNTIQEDCFPPTFTHKITSKWKWQHFPSASQTYRFSLTDWSPFVFLKFLFTFPAIKSLKGHGLTENHFLEPVPWGTGSSWEGRMFASGLLLQSWYTGLTLPAGTSCRAACNTCVSTELCLQGTYECVALCTKRGMRVGTSSSSCSTQQPLRNTPKHSSACLEEAGTCCSGSDSSQFTFNQHHQPETGFFFFGERLLLPSEKG